MKNSVVLKIFIIAFFMFGKLGVLFSQVGIGTTTPSSKLDVVGAGTTSATISLKVGNASSTILTVRNDGLVEVSSTTQGFLPPRMTTTQRGAISSPATGLVIFNTSTNSLETRKSTGWVSLSESFVALPTVVIGAQQWMRENLEVTSCRNGDLIPEVTNQADWASLTTGAWCWYNNVPDNGAVYGKLYNWYAVNDSRGLCPLGWHVPTDAEWSMLSTLLGGDAGSKMKTAGTARWNDPNGGTNSSGFAALPGGMRGEGGTYSGVGYDGYWWSATEFSSVFSWGRDLNNEESAIFRGSENKKRGYSVRCIRD